MLLILEKINTLPAANQMEKRRINTDNIHKKVPHAISNVSEKICTDGSGMFPPKTIVKGECLIITLLKKNNEPKFIDQICFKCAVHLESRSEFKELSWTFFYNKWIKENHNHDSHNHNHYHESWIKKKSAAEWVIAFEGSITR